MGMRRYVGFLRRCVGYHQKEFFLPGEAYFLELSSEPGNLMNKNSFKYSGLANNESLDVQDNTKGISFSKKNSKNRSQPKRNLVTVDLKKGFRQVAQTIMNKTEGANYRKDLTKPALARW